MSDMERNAKHLLNEGISLVKKGKNDEAILKFLDLAANYPRSDVADNAYYNMGQIYLKQGKFQKAYVAYKTVMDQYPKSDAAMFADDQLQEIKHQADPSSDLFEKGQMAYIQENFKLARELMTKLITETPESELADNAYFTLGVLGKRMGDLNESKRYFDLVLERYPHSDAAKLVNEMRQD